MSEPRIIKKYPNRRLYDTEESRYITLTDIKRLVVEKVDFVVVEKKTGKDITRSIMLQVISEQEQSGEPIMSRDFLSQIIRSYGSAMQGMVGGYLDQSLRLFMGQQQQLRDRVKEVVGVDPVGMVAGIAQKNYQRWKALQEEIFRNFASSRHESEDSDGEPRPKAPRAASADPAPATGRRQE
jgi:polyhydroxyalkanoate synthesis repressor PhaR